MKTKLVILALVTSHWCVSQTNTFPSSGNVGIGTTSPDLTLSVEGSVRVKEFLKFNNPPSHQNFITGQYEPMIYGSTSGGSIPAGSSSLILQSGSTASNRHMFFRTGDQTRLFIEYSGNIGMGTTTPASRLDVAGLTTTQGIRIPGRYVFGQDQSAIEIEVPNGSYNAIRGYDGTQYVGTIHFFDDNWEGGLPSKSAGSINLSALTAITIGSWFNPAAYFRTGDGKVGIGTTDPSARLTVSGNGGGNVDFRINGRLQTGDSNSAGGVWLSDANNMFVGQAGTNVGFWTAGAGWNAFQITQGGNVGIGTTTPDAKLSVKGQIHAQEVKVDLNGAVAPDYVFDEDYKLPSLEEIQSYIKTNKHLPEVPSATEMEMNGMNLGEMNLLLLKKVEELILYLVQQDLRIRELESNVKKGEK